MWTWLRRLIQKPARPAPAPTAAEIDAAEVRRRAEAAATTVARVLERPADTPVFGDEFQRLARAEREALREALDRDLADRPMAERCAAAGLLTEVDASAALRRLLGLLEDPALGPDLADRVILDFWRALRPSSGEAPAFDADRALDALEAWAGRLRPFRRAQFPSMLQHIASARAAATLRAGLEDADPRYRSQCALALARRGDGAGLSLIASVLEGAFDAVPGLEYTATRALKQLVEETDDPAVRMDAFDLAETTLARTLGAGDARSANHVRNLLDVVETAPSRDAACERVLGTPGMDWARADAFDRLAKARGAEFLPRIAEALADDDLARSACAACARLGTQAAASTGLAEAVARRLRVPRDADAAARALAAMGRAQDPALAENWDALSPLRRFDLRLRAQGAGPSDLIDLIAALELVDPGGVAALHGSETDAEGFDDFYRLLHEADALEHLDTEDARIPPNYVELFTLLAGLAAPRFALDHIAMRAPEADAGDDPEPPEVTFVLDGAPQLFRPAPMGDWFDMAGALGHLNGALAARERPERFATLYTGDQTALLVLGHGAKMQAAMAEVDFPLEGDPEAAVRAGQAYERRVLTQIRGDG